MIALKAHFDGKVLVPDEPLNLPINQKVRISVEPIESAESALTNAQPKSQRVDLGKLRGADRLGPFNPNPLFPDEDSLWEGTSGNCLENGPNKPGLKPPSR